MSQTKAETPATNIQNRSRYHSWSRIKRSPEEKSRLQNLKNYKKCSENPDNFAKFQETAEGTAHICFSPDGDWFKVRN